MLWSAVPADLPRLLAIRDTSGADALSDPALVSEAVLRRLIAGGAAYLWDEDGRIAGFAAVDDGAIHLLVDSDARGKGVGRELVAAACSMLKKTGHTSSTLSLAAGSVAERHYRSAGWIVAGETPTVGFVLKKPL